MSAAAYDRGSICGGGDLHLARVVTARYAHLHSAGQKSVSHVVITFVSDVMIQCTASRYPALLTKSRIDRSEATP